MSIEAVNLIICISCVVVVAACFIGVQYDAHRIREANKAIADITAGSSASHNQGKRTP